MAQRRRKSSHGGSRPGAGAKPVFRERILRSMSFERQDLEAAQALAHRRGVRLSLIVRDAIRQYLNRQRRK